MLHILGLGEERRRGGGGGGGGGKWEEEERWDGSRAFYHLLLHIFWKKMGFGRREGGIRAAGEIEERGVGRRGEVLEGPRRGGERRGLWEDEPRILPSFASHFQKKLGLGRRGGAEVRWLGRGGKGRGHFIILYFTFSGRSWGWEGEVGEWR